MQDEQAQTILLVIFTAISFSCIDEQLHDWQDRTLTHLLRFSWYISVIKRLEWICETSNTNSESNWNQFVGSLRMMQVALQPVAFWFVSLLSLLHRTIVWFTFHIVLELFWRKDFLSSAPASNSYRVPALQSRFRVSMTCCVYSRAAFFSSKTSNPSSCSKTVFQARMIIMRVKTWAPVMGGPNLRRIYHFRIFST